MSTCKRQSKVSRSSLREFETEQDGVIRVGVIPFVRIAKREYWLMTRQPDGKFSDFGGGRKRTETLEEALLREVDEESSGLLTKIVADRLARKQKITVLRARNGVRGDRGAFFLMMEVPYIEESRFKPNKEVSEIRWIEKQKVIAGTWSIVNRSVVPYTKFLYFEAKDKN
ncbi:putative NUDIX hydrolase [Golden Marseillevirus]|uniref:putative NUDIX hydrolase n=1 Tax=Golden Marseillevirus TaxID=1720526 RepID=UPI000877ACDC|nr:putative NUDIX hydrolase [Golden Marseillevirus]ALX27532.1 putative NUDIX hydrolase [Golden Marseillevirus]